MVRLHERRKDDDAANEAIKTAKEPLEQAGERDTVYNKGIRSSFQFKMQATRILRALWQRANIE